MPLEGRRGLWERGEGLGLGAPRERENFGLEEDEGVGEGMVEGLRWLGCSVFG